MAVGDKDTHTMFVVSSLAMTVIITWMCAHVDPIAVTSMMVITWLYTCLYPVAVRELARLGLVDHSTTVFTLLGLFGVLGAAPLHVEVSLAASKEIVSTHINL